MSFVLLKLGFGMVLVCHSAGFDTVLAWFYFGFHLVLACLCVVFAWVWHEVSMILVCRWCGFGVMFIYFLHDFTVILASCVVLAWFGHGYCRFVFGIGMVLMYFDAFSFV